jgi:hypothetical protein
MNGEKLLQVPFRIARALALVIDFLEASTEEGKPDKKEIREVMANRVDRILSKIHFSLRINGCGTEPLQCLRCDSCSKDVSISAFSPDTKASQTSK